MPAPLLIDMNARIACAQLFMQIPEVAVLH